jgi:hypothetical protein
MLFYTFKWTSFFMGKFAIRTLASLARFSIRSIMRGISILGGMLFDQNAGAQIEDEDPELLEEERHPPHR